MKKNSIFFERILQIIDYYDIRSVNSFALDHLKYNSSEKINRLKSENTNPSYEILCDIANKFEEIDMNWLILGVGDMIKSKKIKENSEVVSDDGIKIVDNTSIGFILDRYEALAAENALLKKENEILKNKRSAPAISYNDRLDSNEITISIAAEPKNHK